MNNSNQNHNQNNDNHNNQYGETNQFGTNHNSSDNNQQQSNYYQNNTYNPYIHNNVQREDINSQSEFQHPNHSENYQNQYKQNQGQNFSNQFSHNQNNFNQPTNETYGQHQNFYNQEYNQQGQNYYGNSTLNREPHPMDIPEPKKSGKIDTIGMLFICGTLFLTGISCIVLLLLFLIMGSSWTDFGLEKPSYSCEEISKPSECEAFEDIDYNSSLTQEEQKILNQVEFPSPDTYYSMFRDKYGRTTLIGTSDFTDTFAYKVDNNYYLEYKYYSFKYKKESSSKQDDKESALRVAKVLEDIDIPNKSFMDNTMYLYANGTKKDNTMGGSYSYAAAYAFPSSYTENNVLLFESDLATIAHETGHIWSFRTGFETDDYERKEYQEFRGWDDSEVTGEDWNSSISERFAENFVDGVYDETLTSRFDENLNKEEMKQFIYNYTPSYDKSVNVDYKFVTANNYKYLVKDFIISNYRQNSYFYNKTTLDRDLNAKLLKPNETTEKIDRKNVTIPSGSNIKVYFVDKYYNPGVYFEYEGQKYQANIFNF